MKSLVRGSLVAVLVTLASLATGCGTQFTATELNATVPMGPQRPGSSVEVFASAPPTRPHVDVRVLEGMQQVLDEDATLIDQLRDEAGREGCDAIYVKSMFPGTPRHPQRVSATCIVYTNAAPTVAAAGLAPNDGPGAVVAAPR
ncbi:MAG TPA: hypothetical protein VGM56_10490 [Byssovorax sp.]|jgi:hypothetical protein